MSVVSKVQLAHSFILQNLSKPALSVLTIYEIEEYERDLIAYHVNLHVLTQVECIKDFHIDIYIVDIFSPQNKDKHCSVF